MIDFGLLDTRVISLDKKSPVVLYGAGNIGKEVFKVLTAKGFSIQYFIDGKSEQVHYWENTPILPLTALPPTNPRTVIVTIHNRDVFMPSIISKLKDVGFEHVYTMIDIFDLVGDELGDRFWLTKRKYYRANSANLTEGYQLWSDAKSREIYKAVVEFRMSGNYEVLPEREEPQYFPDDVPRWAEPSRMIDAGAYDGDTVRSLRSSGYKVDSVVSFEPDMRNFSRLKECGSRDLLGFDVMLYPCGVWSETARLEFQTGHGEGSRVNPDSRKGEFVQCVALDDVLPDFKPNLIKMDIEGAEIEALHGARKIIQESLPGLAICVYHHPDHIWQIAKLIKDYSEDYSLFLRHHGYNSFELVLYAIPR